MDIITVHDLKVSTLIGVYPFERQMKQALYITCQFATNTKAIAEQDDIQKATDYEALSDTIMAFAESNAFFLIETFAEKLSSQILTQFNLSWLKLTITKPAALKNTKGVSITLERSASET